LIGKCWCEHALEKSFNAEYAEAAEGRRVDLLPDSSKRKSSADLGDLSVPCVVQLKFVK